MEGDRAAPEVTRADLLASMPQALKDAFPLVPWRIEALWRLELPVHQVLVSELAWLFDLPLWQLNGERFRVSPRHVREDPDRFPDHYRRVMSSDLSCPVHLVEHNGRLVALDGYHRLLRADIEGRAQLPAMILRGPDLESICRQ